MRELYNSEWAIVKSKLAVLRNMISVCSADNTVKKVTAHYLVMKTSKVVLCSRQSHHEFLQVSLTHKTRVILYIRA